MACDPRVGEVQGSTLVQKPNYEPPSVDNFCRGAGGGCGFDLGCIALENRSCAGARRLRNRRASAGGTGRRDAGGKAALDESVYDPPNALDRAGADRGNQCRFVVVGCEGMEGDPRPPICPGFGPENVLSLAADPRP
jgi:hypothetical protein